MNYIQTLQDNFEKRKVLNKRYSLRAFARDLALSPAFLSQVLHAQRSLSIDKALSVVQKLDLSQGQAKAFIASVLNSNPKTKGIEPYLHMESGQLGATSIHSTKEQKGKARAIKRRAVSVLTFSEIADWYYSGIIALSQCEKNGITPEVIAKKFGIEPAISQRALAKLLAIGLLKSNRNGSLSGDGELVKIHSSPSSAIRNHHAQFLGKAKHALYNHRPQERDITGTTFLMDAQNIKQAKKIIEEFRERMNTLFSSNNEQAKVFRLSVQLFSLEE